MNSWVAVARVFRGGRPWLRTVMADDASPPASHAAASAAAGPFAHSPNEQEAGDAEAESIDNLEAKIVSTSNTLDEEPFLPVKSIITLFRIEAPPPSRGGQHFRSPSRTLLWRLRR